MRFPPWVALAALIFASATQAAANTIVVKSTGPSAERYAVGTIIAPDREIVLQSGDELTLLDSGGTIVLTGPLRRQGVTRNRSAEQETRLDVLIARRQQDRSRLGGSRDYTTEVRQALVIAQEPGNDRHEAGSRAPTIWQVDPSLPGPWCYRDAEELELWRFNAKEGYDVYFSSANGERVKMRWGRDQNFTFWPSQLIPEDGSSYFVQAAQKYEHYITLHHIEFDGDLVQLAQALAENKCYYQLDLLTE